MTDWREDWKERTTPRERVETIAETHHRPATVAEIAEWALVEREFAEGVVTELFDEGVLEEHSGDRYMLSNAWALAQEIRELGEETEDGVLVPYDVLDELEGRD